MNNKLFVILLEKRNIESSIQLRKQVPISKKESRSIGHRIGPASIIIHEQDKLHTNCDTQTVATRVYVSVSHV